MADALASGASVRKDVGVQVPPRPPLLGIFRYPNMRVRGDGYPSGARRTAWLPERNTRILRRSAALRPIGCN